MFFVIISGVALLYPDIIIKNFMGFNGTFLTAMVHLVSGYVLTLFLVIHIYFSTIGKTPLNNFRSIITGWHG